MDFTQYADKWGNITNPYAGQLTPGEWSEGTVSVAFLQEHFGHCQSLDDCVTSTESDGLKLFFEHLKTQDLRKE